MSDLVPSADRLTLVPEYARAIMKTPSVLVPEQVRPALFECWACHRALKDMETPLPIASVMSVWINRFGLTTDDATDILLSLQHPDHMAGMNFAGELVAKLAGLVSMRLRQRRTEAEVAQRRREDEGAKRQRGEEGSEIVGRFAASLGTM